MSNKKRVTIFASYDKDNQLKKYVLTFLSYLRELSDYLVFISDCDYSEKYKKYLDSYVDYYECKKHGEYDFGSYKRGLQYLDNKEILNQYDELIICNDSCLCLNSLKKIIETMSLKRNDFWGMTKSIEITPHLQSFFLVFKKNVFVTNDFKKYFYSVSPKKDFWDIVYSYELPLEKYFNDLGFKSDSFFSLNEKSNPCTFPNVLLDVNCPLIKKKVFLEDSYSRDSVLFLLVRINKEYKSNISDLLEIYNKNFFFELLLELFIKKYRKFLFCTETSKRGETRFKLFNIPFIYILNKGKTEEEEYCFENRFMYFFNNILKYKFFYFETKFFSDFFVKNEEWELSKSIEYGKHVAIYGFGPYGQDFFIKYFNKFRITGLYDINYKKIGSFIENPDNINKANYDYIVISVMDKKTRSSVIDYLSSLGVFAEKLVFINYKS